MAQVLLTSRFEWCVHPLLKNSNVNGVLCSSKSSLQTRLELLGSGFHFPVCQWLFRWSWTVCACVSLDAEISSKSRKAVQKKPRRWEKKRSLLEKHLWYVSFYRNNCVRGGKQLHLMLKRCMVESWSSAMLGEMSHWLVTFSSNLGSSSRTLLGFSPPLQPQSLTTRPGNSSLHPSPLPLKTLHWVYNNLWLYFFSAVW